MIVFALILSLINLKFKNRVIEIITMILIVYFGIFRVFSVNKYQRMIENQKFAKAVKPMTDFSKNIKLEQQIPRTRNTLNVQTAKKK